MVVKHGLYERMKLKELKHLRCVSRW